MTLTVHWDVCHIHVCVVARGGIWGGYHRTPLGCPLSPRLVLSPVSTLPQLLGPSWWGGWTQALLPRWVCGVPALHGLPAACCFSGLAESRHLGPRATGLLSRLLFFHWAQFWAWKSRCAGQGWAAGRRGVGGGSLSVKEAAAWVCLGQSGCCPAPQPSPPPCELR